MRKKYLLEELVRVAARENNAKRSYLYVNPLQGKHIPASPESCLMLFSELSVMLEKRYSKERLLVIGFAETATAIGAAAAVGASNAVYYMTTTRENIPDCEYIFFTEAHSHAAQQKLAVNGLEECLKSTDRIIFADDEITTGNTIMQLVDALKNQFPGTAKKFGIVSILNSMTDERLCALENNGIACDYICRLPFEYRIDEIRHRIYNDSKKIEVDNSNNVNIISLERYFDFRTVQQIECIKSGCQAFTEAANKHISVSDGDDVLILGTEEFMYPAMLLGNSIEKKYSNVQVNFHAVTRSPIMTSSDDDYPLHCRVELDSFYEKYRHTFLYNLRGYDKVIVVTDAYELNSSAVYKLINALNKYGNENILFFHWNGDSSEKQLF